MEGIVLHTGKITVNQTEHLRPNEGWVWLRPVSSNCPPQPYPVSTGPECICSAQPQNLCAHQGAGPSRPRFSRPGRHHQQSAQAKHQSGLPPGKCWAKPREIQGRPSTKSSSHSRPGAPYPRTASAVRWKLQKAEHVASPQNDFPEASHIKAICFL